MDRNLQTRRAEVRRRLAAQKLSAAYFTSPAIVRYLSGYTGSEAALLVSGPRAWIITDSRYQEEASRSAPGCRLVLWKKGMAATAAEILGRSAGTRRNGGLGVEAEHLSFREAEAFRAAGMTPCPLAPDFAGLRQVKTAAETAAVRRSIRIAEAAFRELLPRIRAGMTEREIKAELEYLALRHGAEGMSFPTIVAIGANSSLPHAQAGKNRLRPGVPLLIDFGVFAGGYASDLTRTLFLDRVPEFWRERYSLVLAAQAAGVAAIRAGAAGSVADTAAREVFRAAKMEKHFIHSLGHGIGLEIHEAPRLSRLAGELPRGSIVTVEPGLYFPGKGGIRIEDDVLVGAGGGEVLSTLARDLGSCVL